MLRQINRKYKLRTLANSLYVFKGQCAVSKINLETGQLTVIECIDFIEIIKLLDLFKKPIHSCDTDPEKNGEIIFGV